MSGGGLLLSRIMKLKFQMFLESQITITDFVLLKVLLSLCFCAFLVKKDVHVFKHTSFSSWHQIKRKCFHQYVISQKAKIRQSFSCYGNSLGAQNFTRNTMGFQQIMTVDKYGRLSREMVLEFVLEDSWIAQVAVLTPRVFSIICSPLLVLRLL